MRSASRKWPHFGWANCVVWPVLLSMADSEWPGHNVLKSLLHTSVVQPLYIWSSVATFRVPPFFFLHLYTVEFGDLRPIPCASRILFATAAAPERRDERVQESILTNVSRRLARRALLLTDRSWRVWLCSCFGSLSPTRFSSEYRWGSYW